MRAYRAVLGAPHAPRLAVGGTVARLLPGGCGLAIVLLARQASGSFAVAGAASGAYFGCAAVMRPVQGRLVDRLGQPRILTATTVLNTLALVGLVVGAQLDVHGAAFVAMAAAVGITLPALSSCLRVLWRGLTPEGDARTTAFALDSLLYETALVSSPLLVGLLAFAASPAAALLALAALGLAGTLTVATSPPARAASGSRDAHHRGRTLTAGLGAVVVIALVVGVAEGSLTVLVPALATHHGVTAASGPFLAALSAGALIGGAIYGARSWRSPPPRRLVVCLAGLAAPLAALAALHTIASLAPLLVLAGLALGPTITTMFLLADRLAASTALTEAFAWLSFATPAGAAAGSVLAGLLIAAVGLGSALWLPCAGAAAAAALALGAQRRLGAR